MVNQLNPTKYFEYPCSSHINCYPLSITLQKGKYLIQCYGASGGDSARGRGGYGAFVSGVIQLYEDKTLYLYIGAEGHLELGKTSYNRGGRGNLYKSEENSQGASGGGGTDVRLLNNSDIDGLLSRIIVAGGGGGAESYYNNVDGGNAGSFVGEDGKYSAKPDFNYQLSLPTGGTETSGGNAGKCITGQNTCTPQTESSSGGFGYGGNATKGYYGGGGGGGYFGGGGASVTTGKTTSGAGGSSYVSGQNGCHSFKLDDLSDDHLIDINSSIHYSNLFFTSIIFQDGNKAKHKGNGKIIITLIDREISINCKFYTPKFQFLLLFVYIN